GDTTGPLVSCPGPITKEATSASGATATFTATASDIVDGTDSVTCAPASGSTFALGSTTVTCTAFDAAHNTNTCTFSVTVVDTTAPLVSCPGPITKEATSASGATATFTATASDIVDGTDSVTCAPASGSTFALGSTTVTCTAFDAAHNTNACTFAVTVVDTTVPLVSCPGPLTKEATSASGATATFTATASDLVDGSDSVTCAPASGSTFALGSTTVTCTAFDAAHNTNTCTFSVTVVDTTAPMVSCPGPITKEATSASGATASFTASASDLVDGTDSVTCAPASGSTFALGSTTVTCTAFDAAHNTN